MWSEAENYDLALSFQEKAGCDEIWEKICQVCPLFFLFFPFVFLFLRCDARADSICAMLSVLNNACKVLA